jgi:hypothetical protein
MLFSIQQMVPHYPPVYPLLLALLGRLFGISDALIYLVLVLQHLLYVVGTLLLCRAFARPWQKAALIVALFLGSYLLMLTHTIATEGLSQALLVLVLGFGVNLCFGAGAGAGADAPADRRRRAWWWGGYGAALLFAALTRHNNPVFLVFLPLAFALRAAFTRSRRPLRPALLALGIGVAAVVVAGGATRVVVWAASGNPDSVMGRNAVYRMQGLPWASMTAVERETLLRRIKSHAPDPLVAEVIAVMIDDPAPWTGAYERVRQLAATDSRRRSADKLMNQAAIAFFKEPRNPWLHRAIWDSFRWYLTAPGNFYFFSRLGVVSIEMYRDNPGVPEPMRKLPLVSRVHLEDYRHLHFLLSVELLDRYVRPLYAGILALLVLAPQLWLRRRLVADHAALVLALLVVTLGYTLATAIVTINVNRYVLPTGLGMWLALGLAIASWGRKQASQECMT